MVTFIKCKPLWYQNSILFARFWFSVGENGIFWETQYWNFLRDSILKLNNRIVSQRLFLCVIMWMKTFFVSSNLEIDHSIPHSPDIFVLLGKNFKYILDTWSDYLVKFFFRRCSFDDWDTCWGVNSIVWSVGINSLKYIVFPFHWRDCIINVIHLLQLNYILKIIKCLCQVDNLNASTKIAHLNLKRKSYSATLELKLRQTTFSSIYLFF